MVHDQWYGTAEERGIWKVSLNDVRVYPVSAGFADLLEEYDVGCKIRLEIITSDGGGPTTKNDEWNNVL